MHANNQEIGKVAVQNHFSKLCRLWCPLFTFCWYEALGNVVQLIIVDKNRQIVYLYVNHDENKLHKLDRSWVNTAEDKRKCFLFDSSTILVTKEWKQKVVYSLTVSRIFDTEYLISTSIVMWFSTNFLIAGMAFALLHSVSKERI